MSAPVTEQIRDANDQASLDMLRKVVAQLVHEQDELATDVSRIKRRLAKRDQRSWTGEYSMSSFVAPEGVEWMRDDKSAVPVKIVFRGLQIQVASVSPLPTPKRVLPSPGRGFADRLFRSWELLKELQAHFANLQRRIVLANSLEEALGVLETQLEGSDCRYLLWTVSVLRDVFSYNYAEDMTETQLRVVEAALGDCGQKAFMFSKSDYERVYRKMLDVGFCLLPNSEKAMAKCCDE